jgi:hypothetical protein
MAPLESQRCATVHDPVQRLVDRRGDFLGCVQLAAICVLFGHLFEILDGFYSR